MCTNNQNNLLTIILILATLPLFGQKNMVPATVLTKAGTSLKGEIDFKDWDKIPEVIKFENSTVDELTPINTEKIEIYGSNPQVFVGKILPVAQFGNSINNYSKTKELKVVQDTIFLRSLEIGYLSLYEHQDDQFTFHYFIVKDGEWEELLYHKYTSGKIIKQVQNYKGQLLSKMEDCPSVQSDLRSLDFNIDKIRSIVNKYNTCSDKGFVTYSDQTKKGKAEFGILAGVGFSQLATRMDGERFDFDFGITPRVGLAATFPVLG